MIILIKDKFFYIVMRTEAEVLLSEVSSQFNFVWYIEYWFKTLKR